MQQYFLKSLVGFFLVVATSHLAPVHSLSFLRALAEEAEVAEQQSLDNNSIDSANELGEPEPEVPAKNPEKNNFGRKFVAVQLEGVRHGVELKEGESYELVCKVDASPEPKVYWVRGDNPTKQIEELFKASVPSELSGTDEDSLSRVESKYVIDCATKEDQGRIHCVAIAGEKTSIQSTVITVKENGNRPTVCRRERPPVITQHTSTIFSVSGSTVVLSCKAIGTPRPQTRWLDNNNNRVVNHRNSRYKVLGNGDLLIEDIEWSDMGGPTCIAESSSGVDRAETFLYPVKKA